MALPRDSNLRILLQPAADAFESRFSQLTSGAEVGIYRNGLDVSYPPGALHLQRAEHASALATAGAHASACSARRHFLSFDGATVRLQNMRDSFGKEFIAR